MIRVLCYWCGRSVWRMTIPDACVCTPAATWLKSHAATNALVVIEEIVQ